MSRRNVRELAAAIAVLLVLTGCGGGEAESEPEETPAQVRTMTEDELVAVLPTLEDVDEGSEITLTCPGGGEAECVRPSVADVEALTASRDFQLAPRGEPAEIEREASGSGLGDLLFARVEQWPDTDTAEARVRDLREDDDEVEGDFDIPIEDTDRGYSPGRAGEGAVEEVEIAGYRAQVMDYEATFTFRDIEPEERLGVEVSVVVDDVVVQVLTATSALGRDRAELRDFSIQLVADMIERLPTAEE